MGESINSLSISSLHPYTSARECRHSWKGTHSFRAFQAYIFMKNIDRRSNALL